MATDPNDPMLLEDEANFNLPTVEGRFDTRGYLTPYSDIAALMVLEHQTHMTNLLTRAGWEFRVAAYEGRAMRGRFRAPRPAGGEAASRAAGEDATLRETVTALVDYMLFVDESPLADRMQGTAGFEAAFEARGPFDRRGRTLREIDLHTRLFRYPCSYMIYTAAFDALPPAARDAVYRRLWQVLSGADRDSRYEHLTRVDRQAIVEILRDTKPDLPDYFGNLRR